LFFPQKCLFSQKSRIKTFFGVLRPKYVFEPTTKSSCASDFVQNFNDIGFLSKFTLLSPGWAYASVKLQHEQQQANHQAISQEPVLGLLEQFLDFVLGSYY
jgi:hypothetical protein